MRLSFGVEEAGDHVVGEVRLGALEIDSLLQDVKARDISCRTLEEAS